MNAEAVTPVNLRRNEIAAVLNVCGRVVDDLIRDNAFPSFKIGGTRLARRVDVLAFNDSLAEQSVAESKEADEPSTTTTVGTDTSNADTSGTVVAPP